MAKLMHFSNSRALICDDYLSTVILVGHEKKNERVLFRQVRDNRWHIMAQIADSFNQGERKDAQYTIH